MLKPDVSEVYGLMGIVGKFKKLAKRQVFTKKAIDPIKTVLIGSST